MHRLRNILPEALATALAVVLLITAAAAFAYQTDEELKKKYAPILGSYEFDMTDYGMDTVTVEVYVDYGVLWAYPDNSDTASEMLSVEGEEFVFRIETPDQGTYEIKFLKDDKGEYTKCHVFNELAGIDVTGTKIK